MQENPMQYQNCPECGSPFDERARQILAGDTSADVIDDGEQR